MELSNITLHIMGCLASAQRFVLRCRSIEMTSSEDLSYCAAHRIAADTLIILLDQLN